MTNKLGISVLATIVLVSSASAQTGWYEDFEDGSPAYGFTMADRGGELGATADIDAIQSEETYLGSTSVYLSESWDIVSRELGIGEGIVSVWFRDTGYDGPNANDIRLRGDEDGDIEGWPAEFVTIELKGERTGHGGGEIDYYYVNRPAPGLNAMNTFYGSDVETGEYIKRRENAWNLATFVMDGGKTYTSVNNHFSTCIVENPLTQLELLCRSGWYYTRGGDPQIMLWDDIAVMPKLQSTTLDAVPDWVRGAAEADLVPSASPDADFVLLPGTESVVRLASPDSELTASWNVERGLLELWFWDPYLTDPGYKTEIGVQNSANPEEYIVVKSYSFVMNSASDVYYASTHNTGHGGSLSIERSKGWHKVTFQKVKNDLRVAIDGNVVDGETLVWNDAPTSLELFIRSGASSSYVNGSGLWLSRLMLAGELPADVSTWMLQ